MNRRRAWSWFVTWTATGGLASFGIIGLLTIGFPLLVLAGGVTAWLLTRRPASRVATWGLLSGASAAAWLVAWTNRDGPGDICHTTPIEQICTQEWNPIPFAVVAALLFGGGIVGFVMQRRRGRTLET